MIDGIDISPSDRAKCKRCGRIIGKGTPRGTKSNPFGNHTEYSHYCYKCFPEEIKEEIRIKEIEIERLKALPKELEKLIKEKKKEIIAMEL